MAGHCFPDRTTKDKKNHSIRSRSLRLYASSHDLVTVYPETWPQPHGIFSTSTA